jgi:hypothetical protein
VNKIVEIDGRQCAESDGATRVPRRNRAILESLRELCGTRSCFVVLGCALSRFWNENPISETAKNQAIAIANIPILAVHLATNQVLVSSNLSSAKIIVHPFWEILQRFGEPHQVLAFV